MCPNWKDERSKFSHWVWVGGRSLSSADSFARLLCTMTSFPLPFVVTTPTTSKQTNETPCSTRSRKSRREDSSMKTAESSYTNRQRMLSYAVPSTMLSALVNRIRYSPLPSKTCQEDETCSKKDGQRRQCSWTRWRALQGVPYNFKVKPSESKFLPIKQLVAN